MSNKIDVLIVGAGPVGLNMALALHSQGVVCRIIDAKSGPAATSNAIGINARTLEIWQTLGCASLAIEHGLKLKEVKLFNGVKMLNYAPFNKIDSQFNFMLSLPQSENEALLIAQLAKHNIQVEWNRELVQLQDGVDEVNLVCKTKENLEEISAKWVIGCDGYHSSVRNLAGFEWQCQAPRQHFIIMDGEVGSDIEKEDISVIFHPAGILLFFPMKNNKIRIVAEISNDPKYKDLKVGTRDAFTDILKERYTSLSIESVDWLSGFYIHECIVDNFKQGRVILAGDAAHSHSPAGGQGMNTGIQDTWNLAWKLGHVVRGEANPVLLDSYNIERRGIANEDRKSVV